jgi:type IV pilus assembly protein PilY1
MRLAIKQSISVMLIHAIVLSSLSHAAVPTAPSYTPIQAVPPNVQTTTARPLIMLNMSKDHQLFYRAYNEYSDYNGDGAPDGTYIHTVRYSGYFDHTKCYAYSTTASRFAPSSAADASNLCTGAWHGNFLNWATMTRADVVRKVLYGGLRSTDSSTLTVLERASLPMDAHSFAKHYVGTTAVPVNRVTPFTETEVTFCNTTYGDNAAISHTNTNPPLLRAARGNFALWNAHERRQCRWEEEKPWDSNGGGNGNVPATTGFPASGDYPSRTTHGLASTINSDFVVRVEVCNASLLGSERCRAYPAGNLKPIGLLQEYGENDQAEFGLMTGSFSRNTSGGVLRKNASSFGNEVNHTTMTDGTSPGDGTFRTVDGIVRALDRLKVYGFRYRDATYSANDNSVAGTPGVGSTFCDFQTIGLTDDKCASWGNPLGEIFIESLRYLGGLSPSTAYSASNSDAKGADMGLTVATWRDPLVGRDAADVATFGAGQCRPVSAVNFNASVISYDRDTAAPFGNLLGAPTLSTSVDAIGVGEGIAGTSRFVGNNGTVSDSSCTAKMIGNLSSVEGLCPTAPAYKGSFSLAGAAYWANTNAIRTVPTGMSVEETQRAFRVRTYGVALSPGVPRIEVSTSGASPLKAVIQPSYRLNHPTRGLGSGTMVDFRVISQSATGGKYLIVWEDSEQGGDYDSDVTGILEWSISGNQLQVTTSTLADATANPQGFGYTVSGTNRDGEHFHSGILNFSYNDATNVPVTRTDGTAHPNVNATGGCNGCARNQPPSRATYTIVGNPAGSLQDPMWYAAKWGGFRNATGIATGTPNTTALWDSVNNLTGNAGSDGVPDTYFEVFNPDQLERSLRQVFEAAVVGSNAAPAVSSSQLISSGLKYVASFDPKRLNGDIQAFSLNNSGSFNTNPAWSVGTQLTSAATASRQVVTNNQTSGIPFTWPTVSGSANGAYLTLLKGSAPLSDAQAERLVAFMRGDRSVEGTYGIRTRNPVNIMGTVVNSSPWIQDRPVARFRTSQHPGYAAFAATHSARTRLLWVGAGDGMLHAFNATDGAPVMSYVPETLAPRLSSLTGQTSVAAFVDGNAFTADVNVAAATSTPDWRTYVFGTLGRGGRGVFALDATNTATLAAAGSAPNAASIFRWQFTANDDSDLGYVLSDISISPATGQAAPIVKLQDGRFAMVFGNGTGSTNGRAVLFILPVEGPNGSGSWTGRYHKIVLDAGTGNGLSTPTLLDTNNDGMADTVYAGDVRGNLWKVNLSSASPTSWGSAYNTTGPTPTPLYIARSPTASGTTRLPITGAPQFSFSSFGGVMVTLATGRSVQSGDFPNSRTQRVFGIWDRPAFATNSRPLPRNTDTLVPRTAIRNAAGEVVLVGDAIDYTNADASLARDGWYYDLPGTSETVMTNLEYRATNVIFTSIRPPETTGCDNVPIGALYLVDPETGLAANSPLGQTTVTINGVTTTVSIAAVTIADQRLRIVNDATDRTNGSPVAPGPAGTCAAGSKLVPQSDGTQLCEARVCPNGSAALRAVGGGGTDRSLCFNQQDSRIQWREIPGLRTR